MLTFEFSLNLGTTVIVIITSSRVSGFSNVRTCFPMVNPFMLKFICPLMSSIVALDFSPSRVNIISAPNNSIPFSSMELISMFLKVMVNRKISQRIMIPMIWDLAK